MQNFQPLVSVIVPCYNQAHFLPDTLASVLDQTYPFWECIIVNDGSTDHTNVVAHEWQNKDGRFKYVEKKNGGLSSARNTGLRVAIGEYIQLLDADDLLESEKIQSQVMCMLGEGGTVDIAVAGYRYFQSSDPARAQLIFGPYNLLPEVVITKNDTKDLIKLFARKNPMVVSAPLYHKSVFERVGLFDENLFANEDWDFHFRCATSGIVFQHCGYLPKSKVLIRIHKTSMSADRNNMFDNLRKLYHKHKSNEIFALENELGTGNYGDGVWRLLKMWLPPAIILLAKKLRSLV